MIERCIRCGGPSGIVMSYHYGDRTVWLDDLTERGKGLLLMEAYGFRVSHNAKGNVLFLCKDLQDKQGERREK